VDARRKGINLGRKKLDTAEAYKKKRLRDTRTRNRSQHLLKTPANEDLGWEDQDEKKGQKTDWKNESNRKVNRGVSLGTRKAAKKHKMTGARGREGSRGNSVETDSERGEIENRKIPRRAQGSKGEVHCFTHQGGKTEGTHKNNKGASTTRREKTESRMLITESGDAGAFLGVVQRKLKSKVEENAARVKENREVERAKQVGRKGRSAA